LIPLAGDKYTVGTRQAFLLSHFLVCQILLNQCTYAIPLKSSP
jgi:hypothetical protein